jgi:hypothetical protein
VSLGPAEIPVVPGAAMLIVGPRRHRAMAYPRTGAGRRFARPALAGTNRRTVARRPDRRREPAAAS